MVNSDDERRRLLDVMTEYVRSSAIARGVDPAVAEKVARSEGLGLGIWQSNAHNKSGIREPSYGVFQLLKGGRGTGFPVGLGNAFEQQTGLDVADPKNWRRGVDFALDHAARNGWGAWYGARKAGIDNWTGIPRTPQQARSTQSPAPDAGLNISQVLQPVTQANRPLPQAPFANNASASAARATQPETSPFKTALGSIFDALEQSSQPQSSNTQDIALQAMRAEADRKRREWAALNAPQGLF